MFQCIKYATMFSYSLTSGSRPFHNVLLSLNRFCQDFTRCFLPSHCCQTMATDSDLDYNDNHDSVWLSICLHLHVPVRHRYNTPACLQSARQMFARQNDTVYDLCAGRAGCRNRFHLRFAARGGIVVGEYAASDEVHSRLSALRGISQLHLRLGPRG